MEGVTSPRSLLSRETLYVMFRKKWLFGGTLAVCLLATAFLHVTSRPEYEASAKVLVKLGREKSVNNLMVDSETYFSVNLRPEDINTEIEILTSPDLIQELVIQRGIERYLPPDSNGDLNQKTHLAIAAVLERLKVQQIINSDVIEIDYVAQNPSDAAETINTLLDLYIDKHIKIHSTQGIRDFLTQQAKQSEEHLAWYEGQLEKFYAQANEKNPAVTSALSLRPRQLQTNESINFMEKKLLELEFERKELLNKFEANSQPVLDLEKRIADTKRILQREREKYAAIEREYSELERQKKLAEERKILYYKKLDEARIQEAMDQRKIISVRVISHAVPPLMPKGLNPLYRYVLALGFAFLLSAVFILLSHYLDDTFYEETMVEQKLHLPVMASIPLMGRLGVANYEKSIEKKVVSSAG